MRRVSAWILVWGLILNLGLIAAKKKPKLSPKPEAQSSPPPVCSFSKIIITPELVNDPEVYAGSGKEIYFQAVAYDEMGREVPAHLKWYFRGLPQEEQLTEVAGHKIIGADSKAVFLAEGLASGVFRIAAEAVDCVDQYGRHPRGIARIAVYPDPSQVAICGPILAKYGEREITNETVLGFINFILQAYVYGPQDLKGYKVRFYLNGKRIKPDRKLIYNKKLTPQFEQEAGYWSWMPVWLAPGDYYAYYELVKDDQPVCSSTSTYFTAR